MSSGKNVFLIGPGFIGWNVLEHLISANYTVTTLVRRESHARQLQQQSGAKTIIGTLDHTDLITQQTLQHDIVIHTATADHLPSVEAVCQGILQRAENGKPTIFIHTSGTSVLDDNASGAFKGEKIYHDNIRAEIDSVPDDAPHRKIDLTILKYQKMVGERAKLAIMIPPLIYGFNANHGRLSIQIPTLTRFALKHGFSGYLGEGLAVESQIHVMDLTRAYMVLLKHMESVPAKEFLENPYFFCENGLTEDTAWVDVAKMIGEGLHKAGKIDSAEPKTVPESMFEDLFGADTPAVIGLNSRSRAVRLRELEWEPREKSMRESYFEDELPEILKEELGEFAGYVGTSIS
jgi:nucleoside-diphosphate-sugar epimerase